MTLVVPFIVTVSVITAQLVSKPSISTVLAPVPEDESSVSSLTTFKVSAAVGHGYKLLPSQIDS